MLFVCYPKCSTCQKAKTWLDAHGVSVTVRDIKTDRPTAEELRAMRGTLTEPGTESPYRNRSVEENLDLFRRMKEGEFAPGSRILRAKMTEDEQLALLATDGMLVKRPLLVADDFVLVGFREKEWEERL